MISVQNLCVDLGKTVLFRNATFLIRPGDRIGLVGRNGAGKSTMLRILIGEQTPSVGEIAKQNGITIGLLSQDLTIDRGLSLLETARTAFADVLALQDLIDRLQHEVVTRTDYETDSYMHLLQQLTDAHDMFDRKGGHTMQGDITRVLTGLGFEQRDMERPIEDFSGGWQMRAELAKLLLMRPDCLLLDEPTNHLDIESIDWLEGFLTSYDGAVVLVSHDRHFLDAVTTRTVEITKFKVYDEPVAYTRYVEIRTEQRELQAAAARNQQREREKMEQWIDRFRSKASLATRVQSRIKALQRMEEIEVDEQDTSAMTFHFPAPPRSGREVLTCASVHKSFGEKHVLKGIDLVLERGQKVAFVGRNGEGKSTLVKIIAGMEKTSGGTCELGHNTMLGLYAQHQAEMLGGQNTAFEVLEKAAPPEMRPRIRALLGAFLFRGDDVNKKVAVLSGGEKSRLALARLLLQPYNLLVLDEPTNHLDMLSKEILKEALLDYQGAMIVVSHDRDFLEGLTDAVVEFKGGKVKWYDGDIKQYFDQRPKTEDRKPADSETEKTAKTKESKEPKETVAVSKSNDERRDVQTKQKNNSGSVVRKVAALETEIAQHETDLRDVEEALASPDLFKDPARQQELLMRYEHLRTRLDAAMAEWTTLNEQLETR